jgi:phosphoglycerol geranylgeranyltransferase
MDTDTRAWIRRGYRAVEALRIAGEQFLGGHANPVPGDWTHVTKVDPENEKLLPLCYPAYLGRTSALSVGGSRSVTPANTEETFELLDLAAPPAFHEPSAAEHVTSSTRKRAAFLAIPEVLNGDVEAIVGTLGEGVEHIHEEMIPGELREKLPSPLVGLLGERVSDFATSWLLSEAVFEGYIIQNPDSAAAREAAVSETDCLSPTEARRRAMAAERRLGSEVIYLEYSGTYGGEEAHDILAELEETLNWARIWYGGGVRKGTDADAVLDAGADAVVVGDVFHDVAGEERDICERAAAALSPDADREAVAAWVDAELAVEDRAATAYLSTVPGVTAPAAVARECLIATVAAWTALADCLDAAADSPPADRRAARDLVTDRLADSAAGEALAAAGPAGLGDEDGDEYLRRVGTALLVERWNLGDPGLPVDHLSVGRTAAARGDGDEG